MQKLPLTLDAVAAEPERVSYEDATRAGERVVMRPLVTDDAPALGQFLGALSPATRRFSTFSRYDLAMAQELCAAINRYDKLRFVVEVVDSGAVIGLIEFSFDLPAGDLARYALYGVALDGATDCRFGPTFADAYQDRGLGTRLFPHVVDVARRFGKSRIILWGGVLADNERAIRYYEKQGFRRVGNFVDSEGLGVIDMVLELGEYQAA